MPRSYQALSASPEKLKHRIERQFENEALAFLREGLLAVLREHETAVKEGATPAFGSIESLLLQYESLLPTRLGDRFMVDSWLIRDLSESWSLGPVKLPRTILPVYGSEWMWQRLPWIAERNRSGQRVYGITLKGRDELGSIQLLDYPWVCHELGHALFAKAPPEFLDEFVRLVEDYCRPILRKAVADSHQVRTLTRNNIERIRQRWLPRGDQQSWIHELAVDLIALWSCGPAFLAAMTDAVDSPRVDPFLAESVHPPYALRLRILCLGAQEIGWANEALGLASLLAKWEQQGQAIVNHNHYIAVAPRELLDQALHWALSACRQWKIPRCDQEVLRACTQRRRANLSVDSAAELIISAWLVFEKNNDDYSDWESRTVSCLRAELDGDA